jgi:hypothetical protein
VPFLHVDGFGGADKGSMHAHTMRLASADRSLVGMKDHPWLHAPHELVWTCHVAFWQLRYDLWGL